MDKQVHLYSIGIIHASACAPMDTPGLDVIDAANKIHPTGGHPWFIDPDAKTFNSGAPNPCVCNDDPARQHWLLTC